MMNEQKWAERFPDQEATLTRAELVDRANACGLNVNKTMIQGWQKQRMLPMPVLRHGARGDSGVWALYPECAVAAIAHIRSLQQHGLRNHQIAEMMLKWQPDDKSPEPCPHCHGTGIVEGAA